MPRIREGFCSERRTRSRRAKRHAQAYLSRLGDRLLGRTSRKRIKAELKRRHCTREEIVAEVGRAKQEQERLKRERIPSVVFFGDGPFSPGGHGKMCPCGALLEDTKAATAMPGCDDATGANDAGTPPTTASQWSFAISDSCVEGGGRDTNQESNNDGARLAERATSDTGRSPPQGHIDEPRLRCHAASSTATSGASTNVNSSDVSCEYFEALKKRGHAPDRDVLAALNIFMCAHNAIRKLAWPSHLLRAS